MNGIVIFLKCFLECIGLNLVKFVEFFVDEIVKVGICLFLGIIFDNYIIKFNLIDVIVDFCNKGIFGFIFWFLGMFIFMSLCIVFLKLSYKLLVMIIKMYWERVYWVYDG